MQPKYTPEQKKLFPEYVWVIVRKDKPDMVIDASVVESIIRDINKNDFLFITNYNTTLHKFDIDEICIRKVRDPERDLIMKLVNSKENIDKKNALSFNQSLEWLKSNNPKLWLI